MKISVYNTGGKKVEDVEVSDSIFGAPQNDDLIHQVYVSASGNERQVLAHTKTRGERAGSGIKPWKQKGTGRARVGSVRTPLWKKGGVAFGPRKNRNFSQKINKKMNSAAISMVLSGKLEDKELLVIDKMELAENKTKKMAQILDNLKVNGKALIVFSEKEKDFRLAGRNLSRSSNILASQLNVSDMLDNKYLIMSKASVKYLEEKYKK